MNKWTKFKDQKPPAMTEVWVSNGIEIWHDYFNTYGLNERNYWIQAEKPDLPVKELHSCHQDIANCVEHSFQVGDPAKLLLIVNNENSGSDSLGSSYVMHIKFCPFCGFTLPKES